MIIGLLRLLLAAHVLWYGVRPGVWRAEFRLASSGLLASVRVVALRLDPAQLDFTLHSATGRYGMYGAWTIDSLPPAAVVAFNSGQFRGATPWGWLVSDGVETQQPGAGPLSMAFVVDSAGIASLVTPEELPAMRARARIAFQSYPALIVDDQVPWALQESGRGVNLEHRDSRLALCIDQTGHVIVAITRFTALGRAGEPFPFGPTIPEMIPVMRALGCRRAVLLDGGVSSQLAVRDRTGAVLQWPNWRSVPLGIEVRQCRDGRLRDTSRKSEALTSRRIC